MHIENITLTMEEALELFNAKTIVEDVRARCSALTTENEQLLLRIKYLEDEVAEYVALLDSQTAPTIVPEPVIITPVPVSDANRETITIGELADMMNVGKGAVRSYLAAHGDPIHWLVNNNTTYWKDEVIPIINARQLSCTVGDPLFRAWHKELKKQIKEAGFSKEEVFNEVCKKLNRVYGIVWCDLYREARTTDKTKACYYLDTQKKGTIHLFSNLVSDMITKEEEAI